MRIVGISLLVFVVVDAVAFTFSRVTLGLVWLEGAYLVVVGILGLVMSPMATDPRGRLRDWALTRDARKWAAKGPSVVKRTYWSPAEYSQDSARLKAIGYKVEDLSYPQRASHELLVRSRRRMPYCFVIFSRTAETAVS